MKSDEIRKSFLSFFKAKEHSIVPSASLLPSAPNLLFTNAGMNPFVPYFLGEQTPAASRIEGANPARDTRATDTQKCIRAGGKHNDLEDVGFDTYHHTFFEMLGNWSFGDYFKKEAIEWAWELLTEHWGFPKHRLYATVYKPGSDEPSSFDEEAYAHWEALFRAEGMDPQKHIHYGGKADNFWMMGDTGPCGPCSEIHVDLTPKGDTEGQLVNADSPWCMEIWNLVFIQFNAAEDGTLTPLQQKHVDTGMGFERIAGIFASTLNFTDFSQPPSNYDSDLFTDLFGYIAKSSGATYQHTVPENPANMSEQERVDVIFRILADHIRTLSFAIADGILPGNEGRNYVLRRILRRAVMWGKRLELPPGFFTSLVAPLIEKMGHAFPELKQHQKTVEKVIAKEEAAFDKTLDKGLAVFEKLGSAHTNQITGQDAFMLYDTYGFPLDLTQIVARERGMTVDNEGFEAEMQKQRQRARNAQKKEGIEVVGADSEQESISSTMFCGYDVSGGKGTKANVLRVKPTDKATFLIVDRTPFYAEMGGQVGDTGQIEYQRQLFQVTDTFKDPQGHYLHQIDSASTAQLPLLEGEHVALYPDVTRRQSIQRHHTATHLLHWALRETLGTHVQQAGSYVGPDRLRFDFSHYEALSADQLRDIQKKINECILQNDPVQWYELPMSEKPGDVIAAFGEKYGDTVRVVEIGGTLALEEVLSPDRETPAYALAERREAGYSAELCGGTHVGATGELGFFWISAQSAVAAGTRRIEALCGHSAYQAIMEQAEQLQQLATRFKCAPSELLSKADATLEEMHALQKHNEAAKQREMASQANELQHAAFEDGQTNWVVSPVRVENTDQMRAIAMQLQSAFEQPLVIVLGAEIGKKINVLAMCNSQAVEQGHKAGDKVRELTGMLGGKGGGKPDFAMGGAPSKGQLTEVLEKYRHAAVSQGSS